MTKQIPIVTYIDVDRDGETVTVECWLSVKSADSWGDPVELTRDEKIRAFTEVNSFNYD